MIESIINITHVSSLDGFISSDVSQLHSINFKGEPEFNGGFGNIYRVTQTNLGSDDELLLKLFKDEGHSYHGLESIKSLHDKLKRREKKTNIHCLNEVPELLGLPFLVFEGYNEISQEFVKGLLILDLNNLGYLDFGLDDTDHPFSDIPLEERFIYAYQLARIVRFLEELKFVHSDLKEDAIWINTTSKHLALIDFDSGYHHDLQLKPNTIGALNQWASKQWRRIIKDHALSDELKTRDRILNEHWVLSNALFQLLYSTVPYFFLKDANTETKEAYLESNKWPNIDPQSPLARNDIHEDYLNVLEIFEGITDALGPRLYKTFEQTFNEGFAKKISQRSSPDNWQKLLLDINQRLENTPNVNHFTILQNEIESEFDVVEAKFSLQNYNQLLINGIAQDYRNSNSKFSLKEDGRINLTLINDVSTIRQELKLKVVKKPPQILSFRASTPERNSLEPVTLYWTTENCYKVQIHDLDEKELPAQHSIQVYPKKTTEYELIACGSFGQKVTKKVRIVVPQPKIIDFKYEINIEKGIQNIDVSWLTENAQHCKITPFIGKQAPEGCKSLDIIEKTNFKLTAYGFFGETSAELLAAPFPKPIIDKLLVPTPKIEIGATLKGTKLQLGINNSVNLIPPFKDFAELEIKETSLIEPTQLNTFIELNNDVIPTASDQPDESWFQSTFNLMKKKLKKDEQAV
ncbi:serine/threonine protein kinase [Roseivirga pacifica]|uniref:Serine/threonine protein kinase n=1 Tax=Roseivirga pacifica TaxID=1267423 RepID=A0A1I0QHU7_9BACT|nr:serine/threonine-protein kinase [Roseivirga pacifica]RKQ42907.1 serine/threonine protein kinase [Roseivirga pacifica]SEW26567.1 Serine/threonine protein kinase [Roseivirga pacifica]